MKKYLMLAGIFTVLAGNTYAQYGDSYNHEENRYQPISTTEARHYRERQYTRNINTYSHDDNNRIRPYIGIDAIHTEASMPNELEEIGISDSYDSLAGVIGIKFNENFGTEIFYQQSGKKDVGTFMQTADITTQFDAYGIDFQGYLPLSQEFEILASLGFAQYNYSVEISEKDYEDDTIGLRMGIGAQYNLTKHIALRGMLRYTHMSDDEYIKGITEFSLGLRFLI